MFKRGVSNIEMILSFLLFIGFVFVALFFFTPGGGNNRLVDSSLNYAMTEISQNASITLLTYSIKINAVSLQQAGIGSTGTVAIQFPPEVTIIPDNYNVYAENYSGTALPVTRDSTDKSIIYLKWEGNQFAVIRFSEDFTSGTTISPVALNTAYYSIASSSTRQVISEKRMLGLNQSYYLDYTNTKDNLNLPSQINFGFSLQYDDGTFINAQRNIPAGLNVYSTLTHRETTLQKTNALRYGDLSVQIW